MKNRTFIAGLVLGVLMIFGQAVAGGVVNRVHGLFVYDALQTTSTLGLTIGSTGQKIPTSFESAALTGPFGTWSAIGANASTSATFTVTGAVAGDACVPELPATTSFHLSANCVVTATDQAKMYVHGDGTGATPVTGNYQVRTIGQ